MKQINLERISNSEGSSTCFTEKIELEEVIPVVT